MDFGMFVDFHIRNGKSQVDAFEEGFKHVEMGEKLGIALIEQGMIEDVADLYYLEKDRLLELERHVVDLSRVERAASNPSHEPPRGPRQDERLAVEGR